MSTAKGHPWHFAYSLIFTYGMRLGEALGLRWSDIDFQRDIFCVRQQILKLDGKLQALPVKTKDSQRELPLTPHIRTLLYELAQAKKIDPSKNTPGLSCSTENLITQSRVGTPVDPRNFSRALDVLIQKAGVPRITPHCGRHMAATLNKNIGTPLRDVQGILGHSSSEITHKIYQHGDIEVQRQAVTKIDALLHPTTPEPHAQNTQTENCCQKLLSLPTPPHKTSPSLDSPICYFVEPLLGFEPRTYGLQSLFATLIRALPTPVICQLQEKGLTEL